MINLSTLDFVLIFVYFVILLIIGYFTSRKQKKEDFLIAERKLGTLSTMATVNASKSGSILMTFVAMIYIWGFSAIWYFIGVVAGALIFIPFAIKLKEKSKNRFYTLADYFKFNYGKKPALFASILSIILMFGFGILNLIAGTKIFVFFTGWPLWLCTVIMSLVILIYLLLGGFKAVAKTDVLQYTAMIIIMILLTIVLFNGSMIPVSEWSFFTADIVTIIGFFIIGIMFPFSSPDLWQRVYSAKGKKQLKNGLLLSVGVYAIFAFLLSLVALTVKTYFPLIDPDLGLVYGFSKLLPSGFVGLGIILLFAAVMSSLDTYIFIGASSLVQGFFNRKKEVIIRYIKYVTILFVGLATIIAILISSLILSSYIFIAFYTVLAIPVLATWMRPKIKPITLSYSFLCGLILAIIGLFLGFYFKMGITPSIVLISIVGSLIGFLIGALVSKFIR